MPGEEDAVNGDTRTLLLETLAAQAGGGGGINVPELLLSRLGGEGDDADPALSVISRYLAQAEEDEASSEDEDEDLLGYPSEMERVRAEERAEAFRRLRETVEQVYEELEELRDRNDTLAAALGACHLCWGEDIACELCGGAGRPGSSVPDKSLLLELVAPAVQRLRRQAEQDQRAPDNQRE